MMSEDSFLKVICSCKENQKINTCKHSLGLAIQVGYCEPPNVAKDIPIGQKQGWAQGGMVGVPQSVPP